MTFIDVFTHFFPDAFFKKFQSMAPDAGMFRRSMKIRTIWDLDARLAVIREFPDYKQVISLASPPIEAFATPEQAPELARIANDSQAELVAKHPDAFAGFLIALPMNNPDAAVAEVERASKQLHGPAVQLYSNIAGKPLDSPEFAPVFEAIHKAGLPIFIHPARNASFADYKGEDKSKYEIWWTFGWPYETSTAMARLVFSGALDRWPDLKIVTHHLGGIAPYLAGRVGYGWDQLGTRTSDEDYFALLKSMKKRPIDYFKMFYGDTAEFGSLAATRCGLDFFGAEHVLFASDCPFEPTPGLYISETLRVMRELGVSDGDLAKICHGNAQRLMPGLK